MKPMIESPAYQKNLTPRGMDQLKEGVTMKRFILFLLIMIFVIPAAALAQEDVKIVSTDATSWIVGKDPLAYTPARMVDGDETTSFQFSTNTTPLGQEYLYFYFGGPSSISTLWIKNGFWRTTGGYDQYVRNSRVKTMVVDFQYSGANGYTDAVTVTLPDDKTRSDWTRISLGSHARVISVRFLIKEIYEGSKFPNDVCISEVKFTDGTAAPSTNLYGLATQKLATRYGPGTQYEEGGTYNVAGQYIRILSRAWDTRNDIWWVKCEIPYKGETRVLWTGYKRFDSSTVPLESIPVENEIGAAAEAWVSAYRQFFTSGSYKQVISSVRLEWSDLLRERDAAWDCASLYDIDGNGIPELIIRVDYGIEQADIFTYGNGRIIWLGSMGGDNFFQDIFYYPGSRQKGLLAALGGPAMSIKQCTLENNRFSCVNVAGTIVNWDAEETVGVQMNVNDASLYTLLYGTFVSKQNTPVSLRWYRSAYLQKDADWSTLFGAAW